MINISFSVCACLKESILSTDPLFCVQFIKIASKSIKHRGFKKAQTQQGGPGRGQEPCHALKKITCNLTTGDVKKA